MAYAEAALGGSTGGSYRVWVNSIRTYDGNQAENFEDWRVEGGLNKIASGPSAYNNYNAANYNLQLGLNGVASSGNFNYNFASSTTGRVLAWGTGSTRVYRSAAGVGFGFTSTMNINMSNSPLLTTGGVGAGDGVQTKYRHASLTALSTDAGGVPFTDEGPAWVEFSNPSGTAVDAWLEMGSRIFTSGSIGSRYDYVFNTTLKNAIQAASPNSNSYTVRIGIHDSMGGDNWDFRDRTGTIKNDTGQADPTFTNFTYADTNSLTASVTGNNQILIQGESTLSTTVSTANKATANKFATMSNYLFTLGGYSESAAWSSGSNVVQAMGAISDVTGVQNLSVRAVDSRGNSKTVTKAVTVLPYSGPGFFLALNVKYTNEFDSSSGLTVAGYDTNAIAIVSPLTNSGSDLNLVNTTSGVKYDIRRADGSFSGTWTNIAITQDAGTGFIRTTLATLATSILGRMNTIGADNTQPWYIKFQLTDKLYVHTYTFTIDVGRPIMRIGADGNLYHKEIEFHNEFHPLYTFLVPGTIANGTVGTWGYAGLSGFAFGSGALSNSSAANADACVLKVFLNVGTYNYTTSFVGASNRGKSEHIIAGYAYGTGSSQYIVDNYFASTTENFFTLNGLTIAEAGWYTFAFVLNGKNASSSGYVQSVIGMRFIKTA